MYHSDLGSQYVSIRYTEQLAEAGIEPSVAAMATPTTTPWPRPSMVCISQADPWSGALEDPREAVELATLE